MLGLWSDNTNHDEPIINLALLIFKLHVYSSREKHVLNIIDLPHKRNKKTGYRLSVKIERHIKKYQLRKSNNKLTYKVCFFLVECL